MWNASIAKYILPLGLLVAGCGGGGGGGGFDTTEQSTPPATGTTTPSGDSDDSTNTPPASTPSDSPSLVQKSGPCADTYDEGFMLVEGLDQTLRRNGFSKPAKGEPYMDPAYGSCVVRVTNARQQGLPGFARNDYSRRQPFNSDDSRILVYAQGQTWHLYDVETTEHVRKLDFEGANSEPVWHPVHPDILYVSPNGGGMQIFEYNVVTDEKKVAADFNELGGIAGRPGSTSIRDIWPNAARVWSRKEGAPSEDGRYWGFIVENANAKGLGMITYDMLANEVTGVYDFATDGGGVPAPDHISMSVTGEYVVPSWNSARFCPSAQQLGTVNKPCGLMSFKRDFSWAVGLDRTSPHSDTGLDTDGRDVIVAPDYDAGWVRMFDLATGESTRLWEIYVGNTSSAMHISSRSFNKPGWVLISTYKGKGTAWHSNKIFAVEMKANPRILNIAHTYNLGGGYFSEPHAAVNRDFTKVMYNSNWNSSNDRNVDAYMIELPEAAIPSD